MIQMSTMPSDRDTRLAEIIRTFETFHKENECVQVCATRRDRQGMSVGYFRDFQKAAEAILQHECSKPKAIYTTLNPFNPALYARQPDAIHPAASAVKDEDILERRWLLIDIDPVRGSGIPADQAEVDAASTLATDVEDALRAKGFPLPIIGETGNGFALLYRVQLPNDEETKQLVKDFMLGVDSLTSEWIDPLKPRAKVDTGVYNAGQLLRVFGTTNRKGGEDFFGSRVHRVAHLNEPPDEIVVVRKECIELVASLGQEAVAKRQTAKNGAGSNGQAAGAATAGRLRLKIGEHLTYHGLQFRVKEIRGGTAYILSECPFNPGHGGNGEVAIFQDASGRLGFECKHDSCRQYTWHDFKRRFPPQRHHWEGLSAKAAAPEKLEPGTKVKAGDRDNIGTIVADQGAAATVHFVSPDGHEATKLLPKSQLVDLNGKRLSSGPPQAIEIIDSKTLAESNLRPRFIIDHVLVSDQLMICGGPAKSLKTSIMVDAAISIGHGAKFLGKFQSHPHTVAMLSGESGAFAIQKTALRVAKARGVDLADPNNAGMIHWGFQLPKISEAAGLDGLAEMILCQPVPIEVVIIDPAYLAMPGVNMTNMFEVGPVLSALAELGQVAGTTFILCHHYRKNSNIERFDVPELAELSMAGFAEFARQWLLLGRRAAYGGDGRHQLWASIGGSVGHSGVYALDIDEGQMGVDFGGRKWDVAVGTVDDARTAGKQATEQRAEDRRKTTEAGNREKLEKALVRYPKGATTTTLKTEAGFNSKDFGAAISTLIDEGLVVACEITKANGQTYDAYRPADEGQTNE